MNKSTLSRAFLYGLVAAVVYSTIAFYANRGHFFEARLKASISHGLICMAMTFLSTSSMEYFFNKFIRIEAKYFGAIFCTALLSIFIMTSMHLALKTPEIFRTIFYSGLTSIPYYLLFPLKLIFEWEQKHSKYAYREEKEWSKKWPIKKISTPYLLRDFLIVLKNNLWKVSSKNYALSTMLPKKCTLNLIDSKIKIVFLGDLMPTYKKDWQLSSEIREIIEECDYLVCNFEGSILKGERVLLDQIHNESILAVLKTLKDPSNIILSVANNHAADFGYDVFIQSVEYLEAQGFKVIGKRDQANIILNNSINLVAATQWSNQHHGYLSFLEHSNTHLDNRMFNILYPHWGHELELFPRAAQIQKAQLLVNDWDAIIGHHSHVPGIITTIDSKLIAYSLGDSSTSLSRRRYRCGQILKIDVGLNFENKWKIGEVQWQYTKLIDGPNENCLTVLRKQHVSNHSDLIN